MRKYLLVILILSFFNCDKKVNQIGLEIDGKFDTEGKATVAKITQTKFGNGNIEDGKSNDYLISFSDDVVKPLEMSCSCSNLVLINEGDLNDDGIDEISIASVSNTDSILQMETYSLAEKRFKMILMSTIGVKKQIKKPELQNFISKNGENVIQSSYFNGIIINRKGEPQNKIQKKLVKAESLN